MNIEKRPNTNPESILQLLRKEMNLPPILIVGMHNSGTSILTEILHESGIFFGANMKHRESHFFSRFINDQLIMGGGDSWARLPLMTVDEVLSFKEQIKPIIMKYWLIDYIQWGYDGASPWGIKDPRLCVLLPLYIQIFPRAKVVHIRRKPEDVAASLSGKYKEGVGILDDFDHWKALTEAHTQRVLEYASECAEYFEISYEEFCRDPIPIAKDLFQFLELTFTENTPQLLSKVTPDRIGSYQRMIEIRQHPIRAKLRSLVDKRFR